MLLQVMSIKHPAEKLCHLSSGTSDFDDQLSISKNEKNAKSHLNISLTLLPTSIAITITNIGIYGYATFWDQELHLCHFRV